MMMTKPQAVAQDAKNASTKIKYFLLWDMNL